MKTETAEVTYVTDWDADPKKWRDEMTDKPQTTMQELEAIAKAYFDDERENADFYGRVGSGLIAAIKKAEELGVVTINKGMAQDMK